MNSAAEQAAAKAAMAASAEHVDWSENRGHLVVEAGGSVVERPQTPNDTAVTWG